MGKEKVRQPNKKAKVLKSEIIYEGKAFGVRRDELIEPTGVRTIREVVTHPGSVAAGPGTWVFAPSAYGSGGRSSWTCSTACRSPWCTAMRTAATSSRGWGPPGTRQ